MLATAIIDKKRDFQELSREEIRFMIDGLTAGTVSDPQIAAWAMAITCRGMNEAETTALTDAMLDSGSRLERGSDRPRIDKHSTGGLGDKVSLILAPLLACFDVEVPMLSGRGLGITGGTLDKLESYPGYRCNLSASEIDAQLQSLGCVITGTTPDIAPADRRLYQLRDVTGTVPSVSLITASIMSKKLAATLDALVLDVKWGSGAFMQSLDQARELADALVATGQRMGVATRAMLTDMNQPLGKMVGNACEANEAVDVLRGDGPADTRELTLRLAASLLVQASLYDDSSRAYDALAARLLDGTAYERFHKMVAAQGGVFQPLLPVAPVATEIGAADSGWLSGLNGAQLGRAVIELGGGRQQLGDRLDHSVGLEMLARLGERVDAGQPVVRIFSSNPDRTRAAAALIRSAITIGERPITAPSLIVPSA
jgi:pyrimidine-nucleoside phosphorylase